MKVSVVIPNYNGAKYIETCLDSLLGMEYKDYELIIIDNCSTDGSLELIKERQEPIRLIENTKNYGFSIAVNQGIEIAKGPYVALLNNDVEVDEKWLGHLYQTIKRSDKIFGVSSKMIRYTERNVIDDAGDQYMMLGWAYKRGDGQGIKNYTSEDEVFSACAGAGIYDRKILEKIGLFDENFFAYMEDVDLSYRARVYGYKVMFSPKAIVYHIGSATSGSKYNKFKVELAARNNVYVVYKNMPLVQLILNMPFIILGDVIKGVFFLKKGYLGLYLSGKYEGLKNLKNIKKTPMGKVSDYIKIQWLLIINSLEYFGYFLNKFKK